MSAHTDPKANQAAADSSPNFWYEIIKISNWAASDSTVLLAMQLRKAVETIDTHWRTVAMEPGDKHGFGPYSLVLKAAHHG